MDESGNSMALKTIFLESRRFTVEIIFILMCIFILFKNKFNVFVFYFTISVMCIFILF